MRRRVGGLGYPDSQDMRRLAPAVSYPSAPGLASPAPPAPAGALMSSPGHALVGQRDIPELICVLTAYPAVINRRVNRASFEHLTNIGSSS
jgi:hypothetical protein